MIRSSLHLTLIRTLALTVVLAVAAQALAGVVERGPWQQDIIVALVFVVGTVMGTRALGFTPLLRGRLVLNVVLPWLTGLAALSVLLLWRYGGSPGDHDITARTDPSIGEQLVALFEPVTARFAHLVDTIAPLADEVRNQAAPIDASDAFTVTAVLGIGLIYIVFDMVIVGLDAKWAVLIPVAALWSAPLLLLRDIPWPITLVTLTGVLVIAMSGTAPPAMARRRLLTVTTTGAVILAVAFGGTLAVLQDREPTYLSLFGSGPGAPVPQDGPIQLTTEVSVGSSLTQQSSRVAYRYLDEDLDTFNQELSGIDRSTWNAMVADARRAPMRISTSTTFDGQTWTIERPASTSTPVTSEDLLINRDIRDIQSPALFVRQIELMNLTGSLIPMTLTPAHVSGIQASYDFAYDELSRRSQSTSYRIESYLASHDADELREDSRGITDVTLSPAYTDVPATTHIDEITAMAREITADADTPYDQLVALQEFFRHPSEFTYDLEVAETIDDDPVWTFLQTRRGYCVQFATTMTVMARSLGIPTRFAQGFLPGDRRASGEVEVTGLRAHAWPEFFFPSYGWVRFEPTPASQTSQAPSWTREANESANPRPTRPPRPTPSPTRTAPTPRPTSPPTATPGGPGSRNASWMHSTPARIGIIAAAGGAVAGALWLVWWRRRNRSVRPIEQQWRQVVREAERVGVILSSSMTPRQVATAIEALLAEADSRDGAARHRNPTLAHSREALDALATAVEVQRYDEQHDEVAASGEPGLAGGLRAAHRRVSATDASAARKLEPATEVILSALKNASH
ncbi:Transglutaminase-like superfamily protein [Micrococcales bacterium KH10]|nr:Transglutaminase-like superfamily protein [Micrococcales bacterium KH10]